LNFPKAKQSGEISIELVAIAVANPIDVMRLIAKPSISVLP